MEIQKFTRPTMQVNLWASLGYGLTLLLIPDIFCDVLKAEKINTAWLRTIGAALLGTNVLGCWLWLKTPNLDMGRVQLATAGLEAFAMALSLMLANSRQNGFGWCKHRYSLRLLSRLD